MAEMKKIVQQNPEQARNILVGQPSMTRALFQAQMRLGMIKAPATGGPPPQPNANLGSLTSQVPPPPAFRAHPSLPPQGAAPPPPQPPRGYPPPSSSQGAPAGPRGYNYPAPPGWDGGGGPYRASPPPPPQPPQENIAAPQQNALLEQVLQMTPEQMDRLTPAQRVQVEQLRALAQSQRR
eukprot:CAMPEP_0198210250 /NCGR_PEP_ID=MMETSP1445-20131203/19988_1 /TAXON_ID=36898 /ORGANISM="Pyramimonas sp., Strain CCMP2087" /LENGTH=179 /DNA_ID=CAMNT_0043884265 /DNA_START=443 /DNA_END=982 /DNA_ORIENTATION=-